VRRMVLLLALFALPAAPLAAQIPERFENLKVLPEDIPRDSLVEVMRGFAQALGVRCVYCHLGPEGSTGLEGVDFDSDSLRTKRTARFMMRMVRDLNSRTLAELPDRRDPPVRVGCITCHRGLPVPTTIESVVMRTLDSAGVQAAVARYRQLRQESMERGRYDFGEGPVNEVARRLVAAGKTAEAATLLEMNAELHPESAAVDMALADVYRTRGERERAIERYRRVLERQPNNAQARRRLQELGAP
jgi:tetratricopeptide (TPR) repeat protein